MIKRWLTRRLTAFLMAIGAALPLAAGTALAQTPTPTPGGAQQAQEGLALTALEEVEDSGFRGTTVLTGSLQGDPQTQQSRAIVSLIPNGGGPFAPGAASIGHAVLLSGSCQAPVRIVRDLGQLLPLSQEGVLGGDLQQDEAVPAWAVVNPISAGITPLTQGILVVAVLDDTFPETVLAQEEFLVEGFDEQVVFADGAFNEQFFLDETALPLEVRNDLRERMLACGFLNPGPQPRVAAGS